MSRTNDAPATNYASLVRGEGVELPYPMSRFRLRHNPQRLAVLRGESRAVAAMLLLHQLQLESVLLFTMCPVEGVSIMRLAAPDGARPKFRQSVR
jgi:hypothetical protein